MHIAHRQLVRLCIKAFSETDCTEDLHKFDVPTLFIHGDADQIVPSADTMELAVKLVKNGTLKIYPALRTVFVRRSKTKSTPTSSNF